MKFLINTKFNIFYALCILLMSCGITMSNNIDRSNYYAHTYEFLKIHIEPENNTLPFRQDVTNEIPLCERDDQLQFITNNSTYRITDNNALCQTGNTATTVVKKGTYRLQNVNDGFTIEMFQTYPRMLSPQKFTIRNSANNEVQFCEPVQNNERKVWTYKVIR